MINKRNPKRGEIVKFRRKCLLILALISYTAGVTLSQNSKQVSQHRSAQSTVSGPLRNVIPIIKPQTPDPSRLNVLAALPIKKMEKTKEKPLNLLFTKKLGILKMKSFGKSGGHPNLVSPKSVSKSPEKQRTKKKMLSKVSDSEPEDYEDQDRFEENKNQEKDPKDRIRGMIPEHLRPREIKDDRLKKLQAQQAEKEARRLKILKMQEQMKRSQLMTKAGLISDEAILKLINRHEISNDLFDDGSKEFKEKTKNTLKNRYSKKPKNSVESEKAFLDEIKTLDRKIRRLKDKIKDIDFKPIDREKSDKELKMLVDEQSKLF